MGPTSWSPVKKLLPSTPLLVLRVKNVKREIKATVGSLAPSPTVHCCVCVSAPGWRAPCLMLQRQGCERRVGSVSERRSRPRPCLQEVSATLRCNRLIRCGGRGRLQLGAGFGTTPGRLWQASDNSVKNNWLLLPSARRKWSKSGQKFCCFWCSVSVSLRGL